MANGRVTKKTPTKKTAIKQEQVGHDTSFSFDDAETNDAMSGVNDNIFAGGLQGDFDFT